MPKHAFLNTLTSCSTLHLVGPMYEGETPFPYTPALFVDGGAAFRPQKDEATLSVGDGDSFGAELDLMLPEKKNFSDLQYALSLVPAHMQTLYLHGFLGGRKDHELINLGEVVGAMKTHLTETTVHFDEAITAFPKGSHTFHQEGLFSLISLEENQITLQGACHYTLDETFTLKPLESRGLSNVGEGDITLTASAPILLFRV